MDASLTFLVPVRQQKIEFLVESIDSVVSQTSPRWRLCLAVHRETSPQVTETVRARIAASKLDVCVNPDNDYAGALNAGLRSCRTPFVALLLSDDRLSENAAEVLERQIAENPETDFFYSARRIIDGTGAFRSLPIAACPEVSRKWFLERGSPVKHLMCWRLAPALLLGGFDSELSPHGCDDYDFPWRMFEAGCRFQTVAECLYYYRIHRDFYRLTTGVPVRKQIATLQLMFRKHAVEEARIDSYIRWAKREYLYVDHAAKLEEILSGVSKNL